MVLLRLGKTSARYAKRMHHRETKANCTIVRVTGCGNAMRIDFEDVFVRAEVRYQMTHRTLVD